jgi:hypothetical protein
VDTETRSTDAKGRICLPRAFANATVIIDQLSETELRIRKAIVCIIIRINIRVVRGARSRARRHDGGETVQVEIGSGTQVASRGPTWRIATPGC